jgi:hypothetical protein
MIPDGSWIITRMSDSSIVGESLSENGWNFSADGTVTVPVAASLEVYRARYGDGDTIENGGKGYEFEVVCLTAEISSIEYERNPDFTSLACHAVAEGGTPPYTYLWSVQGTGLEILEGQGTVDVDVRVDAGASGSVSLLVTDAAEPTPCTDSDTVAIPAQPLGEFNVTINPATGAGTASGTRDAMRFTTTVEATTTTTLPNPPPASITLQAARPADLGETNPVRQLTATLVAGSTPPKYRVQWDITQEKGKWYLQAEFPYESNLANFKVDKREQIVQVANSWVNYQISPSTNCFGIIDHIYTHVGLTLGSGGSGQGLWFANDDDPLKDGQPGAIVFYRSPGQLNTTWTNDKIAANGDIASHSALRVDNGIVDTNCGTPGYAPPFQIHKHATEIDPLYANPGRTPQNPALDIRDRTPSKLTELDDE